MKKITGVMVYYYHICHKRLWYFSKGIAMEENSELVSMGKTIDENTYKRNKKHIMIDEKINIDFLEDWSIIHEVKKSDKLEDASIAQARYYIYILEEKGVHIEKAILDYPSLRRRKEVYLEEEDKKDIEEALDKIARIIDLDKPPREEKKGYCSQCSYYELCFI